MKSGEVGNLYSSCSTYYKAMDVIHSTIMLYAPPVLYCTVSVTQGNTSKEEI